MLTVVTTHFSFFSSLRDKLYERLTSGGLVVQTLVNRYFRSESTAERPRENMVTIKSIHEKGQRMNRTTTSVAETCDEKSFDKKIKRDKFIQNRLRDHLANIFLFNFEKILQAPLGDDSRSR